MSNIPLNPERIGSLNPQESVDFSMPFQDDYRQFSSNRFYGPEGIILNTSDENFDLSENYAQFFPAIHMAVEHEASVRDMHKIAKAVLTIRQWFVEYGSSQQDGIITCLAHQDYPLDKPSRLYTISDTSPTEFFPELHNKKDELSLRIPPDEPVIHFNPYDIVVASGSTYHRSPPLRESTVRTFMRLTYLYEQ
jgi:hypothetical protein